MCSCLAKRKEYPTFFLILSICVMLSTLILCWNLELKRSFWILNIVQVVCLSILVKMNKRQDDSIEGRKILGIFSGEATLIVTLIFTMCTVKNGAIGIVITSVILFLLTLLLIGVIWILFRSVQKYSSFLIINLYGLAATLVVLRSNQYTLGLNVETTMQQIIWSCMITYSISLVAFIISKIAYKIKRR